MQRKKKKAAFNLSDSSKQHSSEHWSPQSKAPMVDKFGTVMRSQYALFRKTIQESLDAESSDGNHSWPGDATSSDSWRFCIAWFSNCYGNEHHRMQNRAILLQCDRPLKVPSVRTAFKGQRSSSITIGLEIGLLTKITFWSLLKVKGLPPLIWVFGHFWLFCTMV